MSRLGLAAVKWLTVIAVVALLAAPVVGQAPQPTSGGTTAKSGAASTTTRTARAWTPPKTGWGDPDIQGIYNYATLTPMERPAQFADKAVLTEAEAAEFEKKRASDVDKNNKRATPEEEIELAWGEDWADPSRLKLTADRRTSLIIDPPNGRFPARVKKTIPPEEQRINAARVLATRRGNRGFHETYTDATSSERCLPSTAGPVLAGTYNNLIQLYQTPGYVAIWREQGRNVRLIPVDGRPRLPEQIETWQGDPRGHWEGNTLVVETRTNFISDLPEDVDRDSYSGANPETFVLTERFTRVAPDTLDYQVTVSDPQTWERPFTIKVPWKRMQGQYEQVYEYQCLENNYDLYHWLTAARKREARGERFDPNAPDVRKGNRGAPGIAGQ